MKIDCISDLHGYYPKLEGGDLLIVAGDLTARDEELEYFKLWIWFDNLNYKKIIVIGGNHDNFLQNGGNPWLGKEKVCYLCDSGTEFEGLKIWGSPWTAAFPGMNPDCMAFTINVGCDTDDWLAEKWALIPDDTDILITHSPAWGYGDKVERGDAIENVGSKSLAKWVLEHQNTLRLHVFGHIHEGYGIYKPEYCSPLSVNASHVNEYYKPVNKPIRVEL